MVPHRQSVETPALHRDQAVRNILAAAQDANSILPAIEIILRTLSVDDDDFVGGNHLAVAEFRKVRRRVFGQMINRVKRHFRRVQEQRRDLMYHAGHVDMQSLMADDLVFTRAVLTLRAALCMHYLRVGFAAQIVTRACGDIRACVATQSSFLQQFSTASQT